ncbi:hypothetical protein F5Y07DRAFT_397767 [Xylaria sp. FL0933]|nr:hypothetical protein F5Y07DRAFT_397767 [Xylaria sp. FL0933]
MHSHSVLVFTFMFVRSGSLCTAPLSSPASRSNIALTRHSQPEQQFCDSNHGEPSRLGLFCKPAVRLPVCRIASLISSGQQKLDGKLYAHLVAQPQYQTPPQRQALIRRMREAMVKCIILNGIPSVIEAFTAISEIERPEDQDHSCSSSASCLAWISKNISYGLFLSDHCILDIQETELVTLAAIMAQNLLQPTYWHLRACLRVGMEPEEVEAIHKVIESVAAYGGKKLDVQRVADVLDV